MTYDLILVDGSSYLFRAFHALPDLRSRDNQPTGALYGVINMLRKLKNDYPEATMAVIFDAKGKTFRHDMYPEYKANRPKMPEELACQIAPLHETIKAMGLPLITLEGVEADDVIGTLAHQHPGQVLISTGDKDMAQLVNNHITLIDTMKDKIMDRDGVIEKFGIPPEKIIDYLSLMGDTSDNIPGVPKVGPKTAVKWLNEHGNLNNIIANASDIKGKVGDNLRDSIGQLPMSYDLATIKCDVPLEFTASDLSESPADTASLIKLFTHYQFNRWLKAIEPESTSNPAKVKQYDCILDQTLLEAWLDKLKQAELIAIDTETTSIDPMQAHLVGISFCVEANIAAYLPLKHDYLGVPEQLNFDSVLAQLKPILESNKIKKIGQNIKYDLKIFERYDIDVQGIHCDTMLASYVLNSSAGRHNMDDLAKRYLDVETIHYEDIAGKGAKQITFNQVSLDKAAPYAAEDADITLQIYQCLQEKIAKEPKLETLLKQEELPTMFAIHHMETNGVLIDSAKLNQQSQMIAEKVVALEKEAHTLAGEPFNLGSPKQLQTILFEKMQLPILKKTPKGQPSTAEEVLSDLAANYPLPRAVLEYRHLSKLKSTYTDKLPLQVNARTGRVHTSYHQAVANTGRLSSSDPNLQNIPVRTEEGRKIRQAFIARDGYVILAADYSQIELRIMAHLAQDKSLLDAFANNEDIHRATAAEVFYVNKEEVTQEQRRQAKAINFGLIYGMSAFGLAKQLHIDRAQAQRYIDVYFERYPGVARYMEETKNFAIENGYVETLFGRRLYLPEINSKNGLRRKGAERAAINAPMQGTAADIIKRAMISLDHWLETTDIDAKMIMQVHDELVFEVKETDLEKLKTQVNKAMPGAAKLDVPLLVDIGTGFNWDEAH